MTEARNSTGGDISPLKRAFIALEETRARLAAAEASAREPIAIIGIGCRVPGGGNDPQSLWALLRDGVDAIGPIPADRWDVEANYDPDPEAVGRISTRSGGFLGDVRGFDAAHFGITRREAQGIDPQQRLFLEVAWEALEHAGQAPDRLQRSRTGVYVGVAGSDWACLQFATGDRRLLDSHFASGIGHSIVSGRISYLLGLQGPSLSIDTACSSSLVAVHLACQALRSGDCGMALAGGVNLILSPEIYVALSQSRMLAPDGRCKTFDAAADGFSRAEGCGVVVLKKLSDAITGGDRILAVIRGSAVNQDGPSSGLTAPNGPAQEAVIREALARAGLPPRLVGYVEAHGTGTQLGDPLEVRALGEVFGQGRAASTPLYIGSLKTNVGHLEAAAGVAGLIKAVLALRERQIPPHLHFEEPSPHIEWDAWPVKVPTALTPWRPIEGRRIAGVSSFGFSGTNVHVVIEEAPPAPVSRQADVSTVPAAGASQLFVLSARNDAGLREMALRFERRMTNLADDDLAGICRSAAVGRAHLSHRAAIIARDVGELRQRLRELASGIPAEAVHCSVVARRDPPRVAFLFAGQGAQYAGMTQGLYAREPVFRAALDRCAAVLDPRLDRPLRDLLFTATGEASRLDETGVTQPALFAVEYALACLWRAWGVQPEVLIGHSIGEWVAACLAEVLPLEDALVLIAERGRLMQSLPAGGAMAAVFATEADVADAIAALSPALAIAAQNGPLQTVISGPVGAVDEAMAGFAARGVRCQRLAVSHAFHSALVEPVLDQFEATVGQVELRAPTVRVISNVTGQLVDAREVVRSRYWRRHLRETVRFGDGMKTLAALRPDVILEIGPQATLLAFAQANLEAQADASMPLLVGSLRKGRDDSAQMNEALRALFLAGVAIDWRAVWSARPEPLVDVPGYAFQREPLWFPKRPVAGGLGTALGGNHPLLGARLRSALSQVVQYESAVRATDLPFIDDHRVHGHAILPAAGFLEMGLAASREVLGYVGEIREMAIMEPLRFDGDETRFVQTLVHRQPDGGARFEVLSVRAALAGETPGDDWHRHAEGTLLEAVGDSDRAESIDAIRARCTGASSASEHLAALAERGLVFGAALHGLRTIQYTDGEALGEISLPEPGVAGRGDYLLHPALLDACIQLLSSAMTQSGGADPTRGRAYLPLAIESLRFVRPPRGVVWSHARVRAGTHADMLKGDVTIQDAEGVVALLRGVALRAAMPQVEADDALFEIDWIPWTGDDAHWLPAPAALEAAAGPVLSALIREQGPATYRQAFCQLEALCAQWIIRALSELGWKPVPGERVDPTTLAARLRVLPRYERLLGRLLEVLAEDGLLGVDADGWQVRKPLVSLEASECSALLQALVEGHPLSGAQFTLVGRCGPALAGILRGTVDPLQQLFPGGSTGLAESLYRDPPEAKVFNQLVCETVKQVAAVLPEGGRLRVLEVGGGTGGTTSYVVPALPPERTDYLFTDVGASLVMKARDSFAAFRFMKFQSLDLEQPVESQGLGGQRFDLVLASNVVHATSDLRQTLARLRELLLPGGTLLMLEVTGRERWVDVTFGLTEGWWRFTDKELRGDYPLLSRSAWLDLLQECGFDPASIGAPEGFSSQVLLAARRLDDDADACPGAWLLVGEAGGLADEVARQMTATGMAVRCHPGIAGDTTSLRRFVAEHAPGCAGVLHLGSLDISPPEAAGGGSLLPGQATSLGSLLTVVQSLGTCSFSAGSVPRLVVVTRGAVMPGAQSPPGLQLAQTPVWGLAKVIALEHPEWRCLRVDLDPQDSLPVQAERLRDRLRSSAREDQLAVRNGGWFAARLARHVSRAGSNGPCRLEKGRGGTFDELALRPLQRRAPGPGEVEVCMHAAGLNFRDVMNVLAMRDDPEPLGGECAGRVVAVGAGVTRFSVGDDVVAIAEASFASHATTTTALVRHLPPGLGFAEAATLPFAFMTAWHALHTLGSLRRGETVLVHAGAGGVGMAAIQLARSAGARVFATAGSDAKRQLLRNLGVDAVFDSRSLGFEAQVAELTRGRGVDLVLNSLAGEFIGASVRCLSSDGRFLEIGKRDIWSTERFAQERPRARYHAIDLNAMRTEQPTAMAALFDRVMAAVEAGAIEPLPRQCFALDRAADAFRYMAAARHVGKVVLTRIDYDVASLGALDPRASYLVTGGLTGLGLLTAQHLVDRGARHLWLVGRRAPSDEARRLIDTLRTLGAEVSSMQADLAQPAEVRRVLSAVRPDAPLRGVVHSAGLLEDGALMQQSWDSFQRPLGPKVDGSWALHEATLGARLDFFVMYSSIASVLGSSGQGNHAAANAFMDALAAHRQAMGLPGLSISWGAWSEVGAAADRQVDQRVAAQGLDAIAPRRGLQWLDALMADMSAHVCVCPLRWEVVLGRPGARTPFLERFAMPEIERSRARGATPPVTAPGAALMEQLRKASAARRHELLLGFVGDHVARVIGAPGRESIDVRQPLNEIGLDSLMAVELRNRLGNGLGLARSLPATLVFDHPTLEALAGYLAHDVLPPGDGEAAETPEGNAPVDAVGAIGDMSDDEVERLFAQKMKRS